MTIEKPFLSKTKKINSTYNTDNIMSSKKVNSKNKSDKTDHGKNQSRMHIENIRNPNDSKKINKNEKYDDINNLTTDEIFRLADLHFNKKNYIFRHLYDSYNKFLEEDVKNFLENGEHVFTETITPSTYYKYRFKFENIMIDEPTLNNGIEPMFPSDARHENLTYSVKIVADVTQYQDIIDIASDQKITKQIENVERGKHIATIPLMVRSKWCSLHTNKGIDKNECDFDAGGYFIVNGNEKVVICQDRMVENKPLVFVKKDSGSMSYIVQTNSKSYKPHGMTQVISVKMKKDGVMMLRVPILNEVNVCAVFRALGLESDRDIIDYIAYDEHDTDMVDLIRLTLDNCKTDKGAKICSQEEAIDYLIPKLRVLKKYTESDNNTKMLQKQMHLKNLLQNNFLPHVEGPLIKKAFYLGYMLNRLLKVYLGRQPLDDRDSYVNKRIDLPGDLMFELFKQQYKKLLGECKKFFDVRNKSIETPINVIANIKPNIIEQGFKASLSTGHWIRRQGVAQMLQRLTYLITISFLRRVDAPGGDASSAKLTNPRHVHPSSVPMLCVTQTPEHAKVGLTKHLSIISSITIMSRDQYSLLSDFLAKKVTNIVDVPHHKLRNYDMYKVFLNGDWIGMTENAQKLINEMNSKKMEGYFDQKNVSVVADNDECEIRIYCDSGRLYRPTIKVNNNELQLKRHHINNISLNKAQKLTKITDWEEFLIKNPGVIDYVDSEAQPFLLIADKSRVVEEMRQKMIKSVDLVKNVKSRHVDNRYDEMFYLKYTNCEIHPALLMGEINTNVPFSCRNAGPRNIFFYAQSRQAMGIFATNYRDRLDISFILYYPQRPLVSTRSAKYTNSEHLPAGENCMVAIACYTGYNQEDSLIFNRSSIERGKFRAMYLKKYLLQIQKNQSTSQDDQFMKPDPNKVIGMKHGSYDKLNDRGFVPEETQLFSGDVIFGKVTPIEDPNNTGKCFKDSSESYKMFPPGVVDRLYIDIQNQDGYMTRKASIRSERIPRIGDKYCFPESANVEVLTNKGWINIKDVTKTHKVASLINNEHIEYVNPTGIYKFDHDGNIYRLRSQQVDIDCTLNHKLYAKRRDKENYELIEAEKLIGKRFNLKKNCKNLNPDVKTFDLIEGKKIDMNTWLKFFGIWMAEGWSNHYSNYSYQTTICQCKPKIQKIITNVISDLGYKYSVHDNNSKITISNKNLMEYMSLLSVGAPFKRLPEWVWNLSQNQCRTLLEHMILGDGTMSGGTKGSQSYRNSPCYYTSSVGLADDVMKLAIHSGWSGHIVIAKKAGYKTKIRGKDVTANYDNYCVKIIKKKNEPQINHSHIKTQNGQKESIYHYKGNIYCLEVPSHVMMIRQNGKNVWCGNSSRHGKVLPKSLKIKVRHSANISLLF